MKNNYRKKLGQHFLIDEKIINFIIESINPKFNQNIIEIGSGLGAITIPIIKYINLLITIEIDKNLSYILKNKIKNYIDKIIILNEDARFINLKKFINIKNYNKLRIFGSLPYSNSIPILINCIKYFDIIKDMHFVIQKELSDKIINNNLNKNFCRLSVIIKCFFDVYLIYKCIHPNSFYPQPKVNSSIIKIIPKKTNLISLKNIFFLEKITKYIFEKKRKTVKNSLSYIFNKNDLNFLKKLNFIDLNLRAEDLSIEQYCKLSNFYKYKYKKFNLY